MSLVISQDHHCPCCAMPEPSFEHFCIVNGHVEDFIEILFFDELQGTHGLYLLVCPEIETIVRDANLNILVLTSADCKGNCPAQTVVDSPAKQCMKDDVMKSFIMVMFNEQPLVIRDSFILILFPHIIEDSDGC